MKKLVLILIFFFCFNLKAAIILDYETETFLTDIIELITQINKIDKKINYTIILDDNPNAYVDKKNQIYISTGLIKYAPSYETIVGVIAHEIGHLEKFHIAKRINSQKNLNTLSNISNLSLIAGSLITNKGDYLMQTLITKQINIKNYFQAFSREQEREADYYAIQTLKKLNLSPEPLIEFLNLLENRYTQKGVNKEYQKFSTHPVYQERYDIITFNHNYSNYHFNENLNKRFNFIKSKFFGFTEKEPTSLEKYLQNSYLKYAKSIVFSKQGKLKKSMKLLNNIMNNNSQNVFLLETKADILLSHGYSLEAKKFYEKTLKKYPNNHYVSKRIFNIEFSEKKLENKKKNIILFNKFSFLINIFENDKILYNKFEKLAYNIEKSDWINFFNIMREIDMNSISLKDSENYKNELQLIVKKTQDPVLKKIIKNKLNFKK